MSQLGDLLKAKLDSQNVDKPNVSGFDVRIPPRKEINRTGTIDRVSAVLIFYKMVDGLSLSQCKTMIDNNFKGNIEPRELGEFFHAFIVQTLKGI